MSAERDNAADGEQDRLELTPTLGQRLQQECLRIAARHLPEFTWLQLFRPVLERVMELPAPAETRFQRVESPRLGRFFEPPGSRGRPGSHVQAECGRSLAPDVRMRLQEWIGPGIAAMRVHEGPAAAAVARSHRAEAVTIGRDVYFQEGRFQPNQPAGFALLAHEAAHVQAAMTPNIAWQRATQAGAAEEEQTAAAVEQRALLLQRPVTVMVPGTPIYAAIRHVAEGMTASALQSPSSQAELPLRSQSTAQSLRAVIGNPPAPRSLAATAPIQGLPQSTSSPAARPMTAAVDRSQADAPAAASLNIEELREQLFRDLRARIKADFERGA